MRGEGNDELFGDGGAPVGAGGMDFLYGNGGDDLLDGGFDGLADYLNGGSGADQYVQHSWVKASTWQFGFENDWKITDAQDSVINRVHWVP